LKIINKKTRNFTIVPNELIIDPNLTPKAKWILIYILSRPYDWQVYEQEIKRHSKIGRDAIRTGIQELIKASYIDRFKRRNKAGQFTGYEYYAYEKPTIAHTLTEDGKSDIGLSNTTNTDYTKTDGLPSYHDQQYDNANRLDTEDAGLTYTPPNPSRADRMH
jgi:hypothetical protein